MTTGSPTPGLFLIFGSTSEPYREVARAVSSNQLDLVTPASPAVAMPDTSAALQRTRETTPAPLWLDLSQGDTLPDWHAARAQVLSSLNRSRTWLEQSFCRPLLLQLPPTFKNDIVRFAPDLWSIRQLVVETDG